MTALLIWNGDDDDIMKDGKEGHTICTFTISPV